MALKPSTPHSSNNGTMGNTIGGGAKMRPKGVGGNPRARPKTIHVDSGAVQMAEGILSASRGKQGSSSNLTGENLINYKALHELFSFFLNTVLFHIF